MGLVVVVVGALIVVPATARETIGSSIKIKFVSKEAHGKVGVYAVLRTPGECYETRKFILLDEDGKVDSQNALSDAFIITDEVGLGDTVQMKAKSTRSADGDKCKGSISKEFEIKELVPSNG